MLKALYTVANGLFVVIFIAQQFASQHGPSDEEIEPDSDDDGIDTSESEEESGSDGETHATEA